MFGFSYNALREAVYGEQSDRLLIVRYESMVGNPLGTLAAIYGFIGEELYPHDPRHIEPCYDMIEFDLRLGTPGLHDVGRSVEARERKPILPPDLLARYQKDAFWEDLKQLPPSQFAPLRAWPSVRENLSVQGRLHEKRPDQRRPLG